MGFLEFLRRWYQRFAAAPIDIRRVAPNEPLARYAVEKSKFTRTGNATAALFRPKDREVSVFRTLGLGEAQIADLGEREAAAPRGKRLRGWAIVLASDAVELGLEVTPSEPPPRHACIVGWPERQEDVLALRQELARRADSVLLPP